MLNFLYTFILQESQESKGDLSEYLPIIAFVLIILVIALYIFFSISSTFKKRKKQLEELENDTKEQPLTEINASVVRKECFVKTYGVKMPESVKEFYITFLTFSGETIRYGVNEELYLSVDEGVSGTIALINDSFFDFYFKK